MQPLCTLYASIILLSVHQCASVSLNGSRLGSSGPFRSSGLSCTLPSDCGQFAICQAGHCGCPVGYEWTVNLSSCYQVHCTNDATCWKWKHTYCDHNQSVCLCTSTYTYGDQHLTCRLKSGYVFLIVMAILILAGALCIGCCCCCCQVQLLSAAKREKEIEVAQVASQGAGSQPRIKYIQRQDSDHVPKASSNKNVVKQSSSLQPWDVQKWGTSEEALPKPKNKQTKV